MKRYNNYSYENINKCMQCGKLYTYISNEFVYICHSCWYFIPDYIPKEQKCKYQYVRNNKYKLLKEKNEL